MEPFPPSLGCAPVATSTLLNGNNRVLQDKTFLVKNAYLRLTKKEDVIRTENRINSQVF